MECSFSRIYAVWSLKVRRLAGMYAMSTAPARISHQNRWDCALRNFTRTYARTKSVARFRVYSFRRMASRFPVILKTDIVRNLIVGVRRADDYRNAPVAD